MVCGLPSQKTLWCRRGIGLRVRRSGFLLPIIVGSGWHVVFVIRLLNHIQVFTTPWPAVRQASLSFTTSQSLLKLTSIESMMPFNHLILCHPLLLLPSIFQWIGSSHQAAKVLELQHQSLRLPYTGLNSKLLIFTVLEHGKFKIKAPADLVSERAYLLACRKPPSSSVLPWCFSLFL